MKMTTPARSFAAGIGQAVADRTIARKLDPVTREELSEWTKKGPDTRQFVRETWEEVAYRVAFGNSQLVTTTGFDGAEFDRMHHHMRQASVLMSGRHLQHTDEVIGTRNQEVLTNCSSSAANFILFYLLLNGSGVGRAYDDDMMQVDWRHMPNVSVTIRADHPDVLSGEIKTPGGVDHIGFRKVHVFEVPDSREGWAKALEQMEFLTWEGTHRDDLLVFDFSAVRERGAPIKGMQNRPASGPAPLMHAIEKIAELRASKMEPWLSNLYADHYAAECVLVGGARRAARMATKTWRDQNVIDFVNVKKGGVLWSSNNSVTVDEEFWKLVSASAEDLRNENVTTLMLAGHAKNVFEAICHASYHDGTGEPGLINVDKLVQKDGGLERLFDGNYAESERFKLDPRTRRMTASLAKVFASKRHNMIVNPCGEIPLSMLGGYCDVADVVPYHAGGRLNAQGVVESVDRDGWDADAEDAFRVAARALIRVNTMDCLYGKEVKRTNRIGVGFTGIFSYAYARFGYGWKDLVNEQASLPFWKIMARFSNAVVDEATSYSALLGLSTPHTATTVKPAGTTSKLFGLEEGAHLPSMGEYLRWVQFRNDDPLIEEYRAKGYPVRQLKTYSGTTIVGFPTVPTICTLGMGDKLVTAGDATPEEQYQWLMLLEKYWLHGHTDTIRGGEPTWDRHDMGGQVSYTLKYKPEVTSYDEFKRTLKNGQSRVKCCSVMPQTDASAYEYQPEEPVTRERFREIVAGIATGTPVAEEIGFEHVDCGTGGCPIDFLGSDQP